jgi:hypothetical protein
VGGFADNEIPLLSLFLYLFGKAISGFRSAILELSPKTRSMDKLLRRQCQAGSLTGAVHLSKGNAGVLR